MTEDEMIRELAKPILEKLKEMEKTYGRQDLSELPRIKFVKEDLNLPIEINGIEVTAELIDKLELYIQEEIEASHDPILLN